MNDFRYQLEKYRGRGSRYVCPQCGRKYVFTRYVDTHNNNQYVSESVGKCNRLDKYGYHYTPKQYFEDNPWLRDKEFYFFSKHRENEKKEKRKSSASATATALRSTPSVGDGAWRIKNGGNRVYWSPPYYHLEKNYLRRMPPRCIPRICC